MTRIWALIAVQWVLGTLSLALAAGALPGAAAHRAEVFSLAAVAAICGATAVVLLVKGDRP